MRARGCGASRTAGGVYAVTETGPRGHVIECFLCDPAVEVPPELEVNLGISAVGVRAIVTNGRTRLYDVVGQTHYPNVADWIEETRSMGISRRLPANLPWQTIGEGTQLVVMHRRAVVTNWTDYLLREGEIHGQRRCPNGVARDHCERARESHEDRDAPCARIWWQDVEGGQPPMNDTGIGTRAVLRTIADISYGSHARPVGVEPRYRLGIVGVFPIHRIEVVRDGQGGAHIERLEAARRANLPVVLVEE